MWTMPGYEIAEVVCEGIWAVTYRGVRLEDRNAVILKTCNTTYPSLQDIARLKHEYEVSRTLECQGVVKSYALEQHDHKLTLVQEDFGGVPLTQAIRAKAVDLSSFLQAAIQLAEILEELHRNNVVHRHINPGSIFINLATGRVKITNFDIALQTSKESRPDDGLDILVDVLAYVSPEQTGRIGRAIDYRTDFYSLGVTFYELLTGALPFSATDPVELIHCQVAKQPTPPHEVNYAIPGAVSDIVMKLLSKAAEDRYQSAYGLKIDLQECLAQWQTAEKIEGLIPGRSDIPERFEIPQKLYGRETETAALMNAFTRVSLGATELLLVSGYSGVGKSTLVREVHRPIVSQGGYFVSGKFDQFQRDQPYSAFIQAFQELVRQLLAEGEEQVGIWKARLLDALGTIAQVIINVIPEVKLLVGSQPPAPELAPLEAQNRFTLVFRNFVNVFTAPEHPLVIFVDDLQWADSASLNLLRLLLTNPESHYLFVIGAYRDNEVSETHPLTLTSKEIRQAGGVISQIILPSLESPYINQFVADTFHCALRRATPLADLVLVKTGGNPFFMNEFLKSLYTEGLLTFDFRSGVWEWDVAKIQAQNITDNVASLMGDKLQKLTQETQQVLQWAACIGGYFDLQTLAMVLAKSPLEAATNLWEAAAEGLVFPLGEADRPVVPHTQELAPGASGEYKFAHDQVQQACYALIPETERQAAHLHVGQLLLQSASLDNRAQKIFDIVHQLNAGRELIHQQSRRDELAELNLMAGKRAKASMAYQPAWKYFQTGLELLGEDGWEKRYDLVLALHVEAAEAAYLNADFAQMERLVEMVLRKAVTLLDKVRVYEVQIQALMSQGKRLEAVRTALLILKPLGVRFPEKPNKFHALLNFTRTKYLLAGKPIENLSELPDMADPMKMAATRILSAINSAVYLVAPELFPLIIFKQIHLSVRYGHTAGSAVAYASYGIILCGIVGDIESGYRFARLALRLLERFNSRELKAKIHMAVHSFVLPWKEHIRESLEPFHEGYRSALETGDFEFAAYLGPMQPVFSYYAGGELGAVALELASYVEVVNNLKQERTQYGPRIYRQAALNLMSFTEKPYRLVGESYDEEQMLPLHTAYAETTAHFYLNKLMLGYLFHEYHEAIESSVGLERCLSAFNGHFWSAVFYFYNSLTLLATLPRKEKSEQRRLLRKVAGNQRKMRLWAQHAPMNYLHKFYLVEAECARVLGKDGEARESYDKAITLAQENEYLNEEALAYELAGRFYLARGQAHLARYYLHDAHYTYLRWGALAKVRDLEIQYPQFFEAHTTPGLHQPLTSVSTSDLEQRMSNLLDVSSVLKASQTIAGEIVLGRLLTTLMKIIIENAGAQRGFFILKREGQLVIEAEGAVDKAEVTVLQSVPVGTSSDLPTTVVHYVERTNKPVVLSDAIQEGLFATDPYITTKQPRSILCTPLVKQGELIGILYLENNLVPGAFTPDRLEVITLLSAQAAISIENADLYRSLEASKEQVENYSKTLELQVEQRTHELQNRNLALEVANEQVREANRRKSQFLAGMSHELRTPMNAILGFTRLVLRRTGELLPGRQRDNLVKVIESANQLLNLINQLLDLSRLEAGRMQVHPERFDVRHLILACCEMVSPLVKPGVHLQQEIADTVGEVHTDEEGLRHVVLNLLSNAIKFTDAGEVVIRVEEEWSATGEKTLVIAVSDTGIGIPADALETIFEEFQQVEGGVRKREGTGLGLPIAKRWVGLLGGSIVVESEIEKGSTFTVTVPVIYQNP